jgi:hypothetical protein
MLSYSIKTHGDKIPTKICAIPIYALFGPSWLVEIRKNHAFTVPESSELHPKRSEQRYSCINMLYSTLKMQKLLKGVEFSTL